jgi:hypothetical protein
MRLKLSAALLCAVSIALTQAGPADAQGQGQNRAATKKAAKKYGPVPVSMAPPRARITVQPRSFLDAGTYVLPGDRKFTDYAIPPGYSPTSVIENRAGVYRSPLPGPFDLPGRDNPWPWNYCLGC